MKKNKFKKQLLAIVVLSILGSFTFINGNVGQLTEREYTTLSKSTEDTRLNRYDGKTKELIINRNQAQFAKEELILSNDVWQTFSDLDQLNLVGVANALIGKESFPTEEREPRLTVKPTGWHQKRTGKGPDDWFYNRSHLIGYQLTGENDNPKNLMTGTREFNTPGMETYENKIVDYIGLTGNHVRYRVTPNFEGNELVARGIQLEAESVEANDFTFNVYIFNVQDGYEIDYKTGYSKKI